MAKSKDLNAAIKELKKNYKQVLTEAVVYASQEAEKDIYQYALSCLEDYYFNYDPTSYDRSDSLHSAFLPYKHVQSTSSYLISTVGVEYNAGMLADYAGSSYSASKKYGVVDANWVIDNYLDGIHPITDGSSIADEVVYMEVVDDISPTQKMNEYLEKYSKTFKKNLNAYMASYLTRW